MARSGNRKASKKKEGERRKHPKDGGAAAAVKDKSNKGKGKQNEAGGKKKKKVQAPLFGIKGWGILRRKTSMPPTVEICLLRGQDLPRQTPQRDEGKDIQILRRCLQPQLRDIHCKVPEQDDRFQWDQLAGSQWRPRED